MARVGLEEHWSRIEMVKGLSSILRHYRFMIIFMMAKYISMRSIGLVWDHGTLLDRERAWILVESFVFGSLDLNFLIWNHGEIHT